MKAKLALAVLVALWMVPAGTVRQTGRCILTTPVSRSRFPSLAWVYRRRGYGRQCNDLQSRFRYRVGLTSNPGNTGINPGGEGSHPFADNGLLPDTNAVLFMQGPGH